MLNKALLLIFFLFSIAVQAQERVLKQGMFKDLEVTNSITKSYQDSICTFHVKVLDEAQKTDFSKRYTWFHQGEIKSTVGNYSGKVLHGPYEKYDRDNNILEKGNFQYGLRDGAWLSWYTNGNVASRYNWYEGKRKGSFEEYFANGVRHKTGTFKNDKLHGKVYQYGTGGELVSKSRYRNGKFRAEKIKIKKDKKVRQAKVESVASETSEKKHWWKRKKKDGVYMVPQDQPLPITTPETQKKKRFWQKKNKRITTPAPIQVTPQYPQYEVPPSQPVYEIPPQPLEQPVQQESTPENIPPEQQPQP